VNRPVKAIIKEYLVANGYDGLFNPDGDCACSNDDLNPCDEPMADCEAGYKKPCDCGEHDWHIAREEEGK
jgi:hypothetical protein